MDFNFNDIKSNKKNNLSDLFIDKEAIQRLFLAFTICPPDVYKFSSDYSQCIFGKDERIAIYINESNPYLKNSKEFFKDLKELEHANMEIKGGIFNPRMNMHFEISHNFIINFLNAFKKIDCLSSYFIQCCAKNNINDFSNVLQKCRTVELDSTSGGCTIWPFQIYSEYCLVNFTYLSHVFNVDTSNFGIGSKYILINLRTISSDGIFGDIDTYKKYIDWVLKFTINPQAEIILKHPIMNKETAIWLNEYIDRLSKKGWNIKLSEK